MKIKIEVREDQMTNGYRTHLSIARRMVENGTGLLLRTWPGGRTVQFDYGWTEIEETENGFAYVTTLPDRADWEWYREQVEVIVEVPTAELSQTIGVLVQPVEASMVTVES